MLLKVYILLAFIYVFLCTCVFVHMYVFYYINLTKSKATDPEKTVIYTCKSQQEGIMLRHGQRKERVSEKVLRLTWRQRERKNCDPYTFTVISAGGNGQVRQGKQVGIISAGFGVLRLSFGD